MSFYLTLASNGSTRYFPNNTGGSFVTKLPVSVELEGDYEVGLSEVHMSNTYTNIKGREFWFQYVNSSLPMVYSPRKFASIANELFYNGNEKDVLKGDYVCTVKIPSNLYTTNKTFVDTLNELAQTYIHKDAEIDFNYHSVSQKVSLQHKHKKGYMVLSHRLQRLLGLKTRKLTAGVWYISDYPLDLNEDVKNVFVYSDIVAARSVGDQMLSLLRIIPTQRRTDEEEYTVFEKPHYFPVARKQFDTVEINLSNSHGEKYSFTSGATFVTLHFRRRKD